MDQSFISAIDKFLAAVPFDKLHRKLQSKVGGDVIESTDDFLKDFFADWLDRNCGLEPMSDSAAWLKERVHFMIAKGQHDKARNDPNEAAQAVAGLSAEVLQPGYFEHFNPDQPDLDPTEVSIFELLTRINRWQNLIYEAASRNRELVDTDETGDTFKEPLDMEDVMKRVCLEVADTCLTILPQILREGCPDEEEAEELLESYDAVNTFDTFLQQLHSHLETQAEMMESRTELNRRQTLS